MIFQKENGVCNSHFSTFFSVFWFLANIIEELMVKLHGHCPRNGAGEARNITSG